MQALNTQKPALPDPFTISLNDRENGHAYADSSDIVAAYNDNPETSKAIAQRISDLREDGENLTKSKLEAIIFEEREKSPILTWRRQRKHPLYYTHHQNELLKNWVGDGPPVPAKAISHFTNWIIYHSDADEKEVREFAAELAGTKKERLKSKLVAYLGPRADRFLREKNPTEPTEKNIRRTLRAAFRQFNEVAAHILGKVGKGKEQYVSRITKKNRKDQLAAQRKWVEATEVTAEGRDSIKLKDCIRTPEHRYSEMYALAKGQESYFVSMGYIPLFVTITSPAEYHPKPANGTTKWDGSSVLDSHIWFTLRWQRTRAKLWKNHKIKLDGLRVTEPHKDGAEHWHETIYTPPGTLEIIKDAILTHFAHSEHAVVFKSDFLKSDENQDDTEDGKKGKKKKKASAATYMMKYLIKTMPSGSADAIKFGSESDKKRVTSDEVDAADAWRSTWGIHGFQFFGVLYGKQTLWRELRRLEKQPDEPAAMSLWRAARGGKAHHFIATIVSQDPEMATINEIKTEWTTPDENGEIEQISKKGRTVGIEINDIQYITHTTKWELFTDYEALRESEKWGAAEPVTLSHKYPRDPDFVDWTDADPPPKPPPNATWH